MATFRGLVICALVTAATALAGAPAAQAETIFVRCQFTVVKPYIANEGGQDVVRSRMEASNCETNLPSTPVVLEFHIMVSNQDADGVWRAHTNDYSATVDVSNGGQYAVEFPNNGVPIPLRPGGYLASGTATSSLEGFEHPKFVAAEQFAWGVPSIPT